MSEAEDRRQLQDVMLSAAAVDDRDVARYRATLDDEIVGFGEATITGADAWTTSVESQLQAFSSTQHLMSPQLATISGDTASRALMQALHILKTAMARFYSLGDLPD